MTDQSFVERIDSVVEKLAETGPNISLFNLGWFPDDIQQYVKQNWKIVSLGVDLDKFMEKRRNGTLKKYKVRILDSGVSEHSKTAGLYQVIFYACDEKTWLKFVMDIL